ARARRGRREDVPRAERDTVLALVATAAGAEDEMVVVELLSRRADGDGAAPAIAGEDRIAMARLPLPFGLDVQEKRFEPADERVAGVGEGEDRGTEERHDGDGCRERDLGVRELPLGARTQ